MPLREPTAKSSTQPQARAAKTPSLSASGGHQGEITHLLNRWSRGDLQALDQIFPLAFEDLRRIARKCCRGIPWKNFQPTELIGEIYAVLLKQKNVTWESRGQFFTFAALLMERVLLSYKRALGAQKRGGKTPPIPLGEAFDLTGGDASSLSADRQPRQADIPEVLGTAIDVAEKIAALENLDPRLAEIARFRYLLGLSLEETSEALGVSTSTVARGWRHAKRFLARELDGYDS